MKMKGKRYLIILLAIVIALILWTILMDRNSEGSHDVSQLVPSKYDAAISNDFNVKLIGDVEVSVTRGPQRIKNRGRPQPPSCYLDVCEMSNQTRGLSLCLVWAIFRP